MAQLDIISYFTQIFWLTIIIAFFYLIVIRRVLPKIKKINKIRVLSVTLDKERVAKNLDKKEEKEILTNSLGILNKEIRGIEILTNKLILENIKGKNKTLLKEGNQKYIDNITKLLVTSKI